MVEASPESKVAERRADATAESPAAGTVDQPVPVASSAAPILTIKQGEGPRPMPTTAGLAPSPAPGLGLAAAPLLVPPAPGSTPPVPERASSRRPSAAHCWVDTLDAAISTVEA